MIETLRRLKYRPNGGFLLSYLTDRDNSVNSTTGVPITVDPETRV